MTAYTDQLRNDFELRDDIEPVTVTNPTTQASLEGPVYAVKRGLNYREAQLASSLALEGVETVFDLGCGGLGGTVPEQGYYIVRSDDTAWTIVHTVVYSVSGVDIYVTAYARKRL